MASSRRIRENAEVTAHSLRIIGGTHRGRTLRYTGDSRTRPMKDRVREAVFNLLGHDVKGKHVLDLFAGTGALGLEALSRGAARATFFERHFPTADLIGDNARTLGLLDLAEIIPANTFIQFRKPEPFTIASPPVSWVVFCSPPYDVYVEQAADMLWLVETIAAAAPLGSMFVVECDERFDLGLLPCAEQWDHRNYPPAWIALWRKMSF